MITALTMEGFIDKETHEDFKKKIKKIREYELQINVTGGYDTHTREIVEFIQNNETAKCLRTIGLDNAQSSGLYLFLAGEKRICHYRTKFLFHRHFDPITKKISPNLSETEIFLVKFFCERTGISLEKALKLMNENNSRGRILKSYEAKDYGIVHEIW